MSASAVGALVFTTPMFLCWFTGLIALATGVLSYGRQTKGARLADRLAAIGPAFMAAGIAMFGVLHFVRTSAVMQIVPAWMPARLFWTYFCGVALLAAAVSIVFRRYVWLSAPLLAAMFFGFVLMIHLPNVIASPKDRFAWAVMLRDLSFSAGAWTISRDTPGGAPATAARFVIGIAAFFFGIEQLLHPQFIPGVPLRRLTPSFIPLAPMWGYVTGAVLLFAGAAMLTSRRPRGAVALAGFIVTLVVIFIELPGFLKAPAPEMAGALNGVFDTLLYAGALLCAARALPA